MNAEPATRTLHLPPEMRHLWLLFLAVSVLNAVLLWLRFRTHRAQRPDLAPGYRRYLTGYTVGITLPWLVMGWGIEVGGMPSVFSFLRKPTDTPYIAAFNAVVSLELALLCVWVFLYRGAEFIIAHPGTSRGDTPGSIGRIRWSFALIFIGWMTTLVLRYFGILPVPSIP